jgi:hypothetical protein
MRRHVTFFVEKAGFEPRTLETKAEHSNHCATRPVVYLLQCTAKYVKITQKQIRRIRKNTHNSTKYAKNTQGTAPTKYAKIPRICNKMRRIRKKIRKICRIRTPLLATQYNRH